MLQADLIHKLHPEKILFYSEFGYSQLRDNPTQMLTQKV
jgi:hypothetical protein